MASTSGSADRIRVSGSGTGPGPGQVRRWVIGVLAALVLAGPTAAAEPPVLILATEENAPFNYTDPVTGQPTGYGTDVVRAVAERAGVPYTIQVWAWPKAYNLALRVANHCAFSANMTAPRADQFAWIGPFLRSDWGLWGLAGDGKTVADLDDARRYRIAVQRDGSLQKLLKERGRYMTTETTFVNAFQLLKWGRVDLVGAGELNAGHHAKAAETKVELKLNMGSTLQGLACSKATDPAIIARLRTAFAALRADGTLARLVPPANLPRDGDGAGFE